MMKNNKFAVKFLGMICGIIIVFVSFVMKTYLTKLSEKLYLLIALLGFGLFGYNMGDLIKISILRKYPDEERKYRIMENDERNIAINNLAKSKAFDAMTYIFATVILFLSLLKETDIFIALLLAGAYILVYVIMLYHLTKLHKKM